MISSKKEAIPFFIIFLSTLLFIDLLAGLKDPEYGWNAFQYDLLEGVIVTSLTVVSAYFLEKRIKRKKLKEEEIISKKSK